MIDFRRRRHSPNALAILAQGIRREMRRANLLPIASVPSRCWRRPVVWLLSLALTMRPWCSRHASPFIPRSRSRPDSRSHLRLPHVGAQNDKEYPAHSPCGTAAITRLGFPLSVCSAHYCPAQRSAIWHLASAMSCLPRTARTVSGNGCSVVRRPRPAHSRYPISLAASRIAPTTQHPATCGLSPMQCS